MPSEPSSHKSAAASWRTSAYSELEARTRFADDPKKLIVLAQQAHETNDYHALRNVALNSQSPDEALRIVLAHPETRLHEYVSSHANASSETLDAIAFGSGVNNARRNSGGWWRVELALASHRNLSAPARKTLMRAPSIAARLAIAARLDLDDQDIAQLSTDERHEVRRHIAQVLQRIPARCPEVLARLRHDLSPSVRMAAQGTLSTITPNFGNNAATARADLRGHGRG